MAEYFQELRRRERGETISAMRVARYLVDIGLFEDNVTVDWPKEPHPATLEAIKSLPTFAIKMDGKECSICLMDFKKDDKIKCMPCRHMFHELCILTWLSQNNTCPFCRHRLPT